MTKKLLKFGLLSILLLVSLSWMMPAFAADLTSGGSGLDIPTEGTTTLSTSISQKSFGVVVIGMVNYFIGFLGLIATILIIYAGVLLVVSAGNEEAVGKAKKILTYSAAGFIIIMLSFSFVRVITQSAGTGKEPVPPTGSVIDVRPAGALCPNGGVAIYVDNVFSNKICNGATGPETKVTKLNINDANCPMGGVKIEVGTQPATYTCNGNGTTVTDNPAGCGAKGGAAITTNGTTSNVCNGAPGPETTTAIEPPGANCAEGGAAITVDGTTTYTCNGAAGATGETGAPGSAGVNASACNSTSDCAAGQECKSGFCGSSNVGAATSTTSEAASKEDLSKLDKEVDTLGADVAALTKDFDSLVNTLPEKEQKEVKDAVNSAVPLAQKIDDLRAMRDDPKSSPALVAALDKIIDAFEHLKTVREDLDQLRTTMPETKQILAAYDDASKALDKLISKPTESAQLNRFETLYRVLRDLIYKFPVVQARIRALPGSGNAPLTTQVDGLDSVDPTGGTISDYRWSLTGPDGSDVSLGNQPVIMHEFTEANTYAVRLRVSTAQKDAEGYKTAADGIAVLRIRVNPPSSQVRFRINGKEASDLFHVTMQEAQAGLSFDPSQTTPALGRLISKYEWSFGDSAGESRLAPTTVVHSYNKAGEYYMKLEVTDNLGIKDKQIIKLLVKTLAADIRVNPPTGNVNTQFAFTGQRSRSDDGVIKDFTWEILDKSGKIVAESQEEIFNTRFIRPGTYQVNLVVTDITGNKDKLTFELKVISRPPSAAFSTSIPHKNRPARTEFNAIDSYDPDEGDTLTYSWDFNGDGTYEVSGSKNPVATYDYLRKGDYKVTLQVEDGFGLRDSLEKKITVDSVLAADIGMDRQTARVGDEVKFTVKDSNAVAYLWEFGDGETLSTEKAVAAHTYAKSGKFTVKLNFFDSDNGENSDTQRVLISSGDKPMAVIHFTVNGREPPTLDDLCGKGIPGALVTRADIVRFDASNSMNTDGSSRLLGIDWQLPDGKHYTTRETNYKFSDVNREGECFSVDLVVRDQISGKISDEDKAHFKVVNQLPSLTDFVVVAPVTENLVTPAKVTLRAINPKDSDGTLKKFRWYYYREGFEGDKLGLHNTATPDTDMVITSNGEADVTNRYYFVLEVVDSDNGVYSTQERFGEVSYLDIKNGPNLSPVAEFTMDKSTVTVGDSISFVSTSYDPQGDTLPNEAYRWDFDGDGTFDDITTGQTINRQFNTPGEYDVRLKVVYRGLSSSATHKVVIESANALPQAAFTYIIDGTKVSFDASSSRFDPTLKDPTLRFEWDFSTGQDANGDGNNDNDVQSTEMAPVNVYNEKGAYKVKLTAKDMLGMQGVVVREINLNQTEAERQKSAYRSVKITAPKQPITTLDIEMVPSSLQKGGSADVGVVVLNGDNSPYTGKVYFEIVEGSGIFSPNPVDAKDSKAASVFSATDSGKVRIRVRATDTMFGELVEEATFNVK